MSLRALQDRVQQEVGRRDLLKEQLESEKKVLAGLEKNEGTWRAAVLLIEALATTARANICDSVTMLASSAIRDIFGSSAGCELAYKEIGERGAHKPEFTVWDQEGVRADPMHGSGGSAAQVIGTALRVFFLLQSKDLPLVFLDEPLDGVDDTNVVLVAKWLRQLSDELGLQIVMISHLGKDIFEQVADQVLVVERDGDESTVRNV